MILSETAGAASVGRGITAMERPACSVLAATVHEHESATSLGCIGNRIYTRLSDNELHFAIPGRDLARFVDVLTRVINAHAELEAYHRARSAPPPSV